MYLDKVVQWCPDGEFLAIFWVLHFQRAMCCTCQTCILNSHCADVPLRNYSLTHSLNLHYGHTMCRNMVDIQSVTAEIKRGKKKTEERKKQDKNIMSTSATQGGHKNVSYFNYVCWNASDIIHPCYFLNSPMLFFLIKKHQARSKPIPDE